MTKKTATKVRRNWGADRECQLRKWAMEQAVILAGVDKAIVGQGLAQVANQLVSYVKDELPSAPVEGPQEENLECPTDAPPVSR